ncbi:MAG: DUF3025 domain-containing protein [Burkholderiaceae bacterium]|nr:DUF3025 domain-containing protein [Burkholderiaceae bacterium]MEB2320640.1 DUF3025 domain-containing protein [Pseudomonadota bacterium]
MIRVDTGRFGAALEASPWGDPILAAWRRLARDARPEGIALAALDALAREQSLCSGCGRSLRFIAAGSVAVDAYESHIARTGEVPTRTTGAGAVHDLLNALAWLAFPRIKARLNAIQAGIVAREGIGGRRGPVRDAATVFDENAALFVTADSSFAAALRERRWRSLFVEGREAFGQRVSVRLFGHALVQKLLEPYKSICAHAWIVPLPADIDTAEVDAWLAARFAAASPSLDEARPLPVLGVPGWWPANADPGFYADEAVFRPPPR